MELAVKWLVVKVLEAYRHLRIFHLVTGRIITRLRLQR